MSSFVVSYALASCLLVIGIEHDALPAIFLKVSFCKQYSKIVAKSLADE